MTLFWELRKGFEFCNGTLRYTISSLLMACYIFANYYYYCVTVCKDFAIIVFLKLICYFCYVMIWILRKGFEFPFRERMRYNPHHQSLLIAEYSYSMKHIVKITALLVAISAFWFGLLQMSIVPSSHTWLLPIYFVISLGCYGLLMVGVGLMQFPTCPQEALLLQQDIVEGNDFLRKRGVDVGSD